MRHAVYFIAADYFHAMRHFRAAPLRDAAERAFVISRVADYRF